MKPYLVRPRISRVKARNALLLNLFATPGLGSLLAGRWIVGSGQLLLSLAGFAICLAWFVEEMHQLYGQINGDVAVRPVGWILGLGAAIFSAAWMWSLLTSISLLREASNVAAESLKQFGAGLIKLNENRIAPALAALPEWRREGGTISRAYTFKDFSAAMRFANAVAALAEAAQHHPYLGVRGNQVTLVLTTQDAGGLTELDFAMARECDARAMEN